MRLDPIRRKAQASGDSRTTWCLLEGGLQTEQRRHQVRRADRRRPLRDVTKIARIKRQLRSATLLPHTVPISEAGERTRVPVLDDAHPRVPEGLSVGRLE